MKIYLILFLSLILYGDAGSQCLPINFVKRNKDFILHQSRLYLYSPYRIKFKLIKEVKDSIRHKKLYQRYIPKGREMETFRGTSLNALTFLSQLDSLYVETKGLSFINRIFSKKSVINCLVHPIYQDGDFRYQFFYFTRGSYGLDFLVCCYKEKILFIGYGAFVS